MSHKSKICNVALATHIETCFTGFTYAPLIFQGGWFEQLPWERKKMGLKNIVESDVTNILTKLKTECMPSENTEDLAKKFLTQGEKSLGKLSEEMNADWKEAILSQVTKTIKKTIDANTSKEKEKLLNDADASLDLNKPLEALLAREKLAYSNNNIQDLIIAKPVATAKIDTSYEFKQLGMFFTEETCFRPEGLAYSPCGLEQVVLPGESMKETSKLTEEAYSEVTEGTDVTDYRESTITAKEDLTLTSSYERSVKNTIDLEKKSEASVKGKLFKVLDVSLNSKASAGFNSVMEKISKSSSAFTRSLVNEAVTRLTTKSTYESIERRKLTQELTKDRAISNSTNEPMQYIIRDSYCVNSVIHKRTNAQLAWSDCIENPGKELCRPDNIEEVLSKEIKKIYDKWSTAPSPASLGPKPEDKKICTAASTLDKQGSIWNNNDIVFTAIMYGNIPLGSTYIGGSAEIKIIATNTDIVSQQVMGQPSNGATGSSQFSVKITVNDTNATRERVKYQICFKVTSPESAEYYANLDQWRNEQAEAEIEILLTAQKEKLNEFLLSDKVASAIEKRIFQDFFGLTAINNCCELIYHIRSIFDFDKLCFSLQPSWDASGTGCQSSDPVSIYTAQCLKFFLPVKEDKEWQAVTTLLAINAIPHAALHQVGGYINSINDLRDTEFNSTFDTAGWDEKIDAPNQYNLTPYDTLNNGWDTDFESKLNFQLIDAYTVTVPTGGIKIELRPVLCEG